MLVVCRHGRTASNAGGLLLGRADPPLDDVGRAQAAALPPVVGEVARVVSSPLLRARETAAALGRPVEIDDRWIELDDGELDGRPLADVPAELWAGWRADPGFVPPGGPVPPPAVPTVVNSGSPSKKSAAGSTRTTPRHASRTTTSAPRGMARPSTDRAAETWRTPACS